MVKWIQGQFGEEPVADNPEKDDSKEASSPLLPDLEDEDNGSIPD